MGAPFGNRNAAGSHKGKSKKSAYSPFINPASITGMGFSRTGKTKKVKWHNPKRVTDFRNKRH